MSKLRIAAVTVALSLSTASAVAVSRDRPSWLSSELVGRVAGPPADCITLSQVEGPMIVDRQTILYRQGGKRTWRMNLGDTCPSLREDMILIVEPRDNRLCRNDRFRPVDRDSRIPGATCVVPGFVPYDRR